MPRKKNTKPTTISPERTPVVWKPWPDERPALAEDVPYCPEVGTFYHITNLNHATKTQKQG